MSWLVILPTAFAVSALTLFTGFGLGTLLMPVFALFFPASVAIAATGFVHAANSYFKVALLHRAAVWSVVVRFGAPAFLGAWLGAAALTGLAQSEAEFAWRLGGVEGRLTPLGSGLGALILVFAVVEGSSKFRIRARPSWLPVGGLLAGFFGGFSGHQGALRAIFLSPLGLSPERYAATQSALAAIVDTGRIAAYALAISTQRLAGLSEAPPQLLAATTACAFAGSYFARRRLRKITVPTLKRLSAALLWVVGLGLLLGLL